MIERELALDRPVGEPHRQRALPRVQPRRLAMQRAIGVGALLEDASDDRERDLPGGRDVGGLDYQRTGTS